MKNIIKKADRFLYAFCLIRADHRCEVCGNASDAQDPHHILPKSIYPQHRHNPNNIIIVCRRVCHVMAEDHPGQFAAEISRISKLDDRHNWAFENVGKNKYPVDVDYEEQFKGLMLAIELFEKGA